MFFYLGINQWKLNWKHTLLPAKAFSEVFGEELGVGQGKVGLPVGEDTGLLVGLFTGLLVLRFILMHVDLLNNRGGDSLDWSFTTKYQNIKYRTI